MNLWPSKARARWRPWAVTPNPQFRAQSQPGRPRNAFPGARSPGKVAQRGRALSGLPGHSSRRFPSRPVSRVASWWPRKPGARSRAEQAGRAAPARCRSQAGLERAGRQPCAFRPQCAVCSGVCPANSFYFSAWGRGKSQFWFKSLWLATETTSKALKVISRLLSICSIKVFYGGLSGFSLASSLRAAICIHRRAPDAISLLGELLSMHRALKPSFAAIVRF